MPNFSSFQIVDINHAERLIILENKELGITVEIPYGSKEPTSVTVNGAYTILITYTDGTEEEKRILK